MMAEMSRVVRVVKFKLGGRVGSCTCDYRACESEALRSIDLRKHEASVTADLTSCMMHMRDRRSLRDELSCFCRA